MRSFGLAVLIAAILAVGVSASASAEKPSNPGCFGHAVAGLAHTFFPNLGAAASFNARADDGNPGLGQDFVPNAKGTACN